MKQSKLIILFFLTLLIVNQLRAQISPICVLEKFSNQHTDNKEWNSLLDKACDEMNKKKYPEALQTLNEAMRKDSIASKEDYFPNAYIDVIQRRIRRYLAEVKENGTEPIVEKKDEATPVKETNVENKDKTAPVKEAPVVNNEKGEMKAKTTEINEATTKSVEIPPEKKDAPVNKNNNNGEIKFTDKDRQDFQDKGMQKVKQLETFVAQIGSKTTPLALKTQTISSAVKLFDNEEKTVQVSSVTITEKPKFKIRSYLTKLMMLNYSDVKIEWAEFQYASDFIRGLDGNYYGYIIFQQRFNATSLDNQKVYSDITTKKIEIILKVYQKAQQGQVTEQWDVFLGDISVVQTEGK